MTLYRQLLQLIAFPWHFSPLEHLTNVYHILTVLYFKCLVIDTFMLSKVLEDAVQGNRVVGR